MHATKQPYISAKLFKKRLLQYCLVDESWKALEKNTTVRTVNDLHVVDTGLNLKTCFNIYRNNEGGQCHIKIKIVLYNMFNLVMCYLQILQNTHTSLLLQVRLTTGQQSNSMYTTQHQCPKCRKPNFQLCSASYFSRSHYKF